MQQNGAIVSYEGPGRYRHYKGGEYDVAGLGFNERSKEVGFSPEDPVHQVVVYRPLTPGSLLDDMAVTFWLRPRRDFDAMVEREHGPVPRFVLEDAATASAPHGRHSE